MTNCGIVVILGYANTAKLGASFGNCVPLCDDMERLMGIIPRVNEDTDATQRKEPSLGRTFLPNAAFCQI